tara:strand:+ start:3268 stop:3747 length:480 start_codon:yes stop_codon:yes gene_type:complete
MAEKERRKLLPSKEDILSVVAYNPETGLFTANKNNITSKGSKASKGYYYIKVNGVKYYAHRIAFKLVYGHEPFLIDHINRDKSDNRICNLRSVSRSDNGHNRNNNKNRDLPKGVRLRNTNKYEARITINNKTIQIGCFNSSEEAAKNYQLYKHKLGKTL